MKRPLLTAILLLIALAVWAGAQITDATSVPFKIFVAKALTSSNVRGTLMNWISLNTNRPDTLEPFSMRIIVRDTLPGTEGRTVLSVTHAWRGRETASETDTVRRIDQLRLPARERRDGNGMPDSLIYLTLTRVSPTVPGPVAIGDEIQIKFDPVSENEAAVIVIPFDSDTTKGTKTDTSAMIYLGRGAAYATFGWGPLGDTCSARLRPLYSDGLNWGLKSPPDTLADSTWTWNVAPNSWSFKNYGALMDAQYLKVIRSGTRARDTVRVKATLRLRPR